MTIYFVTFIFVSILLYVMDIMRKKNKFLALPFAVVALLTVSTLSGLRDPEVGYDFFFYCAWHFKLAASIDSLGDFIERIGGGEWAYSTLVYATAAFSNSYHVIMFVLTFFTAGMALLAAIRSSDKVPTFLSFAFFLLFIYVTSFNLIRQSLAVSSVWLAYTCYKGRGGGLLFWILAVLSFGFHKSSAVAILTIWIANYFSYCKNLKRMSWIVAIAAISGALSLQILIEYLAQIIPMFEKYLVYVSGDVKAGWAHPVVNKSYILFSFACMAVSLFALHTKMINHKSFFVCLVLIAALACGTSFGRFTVSATRICLFFIPLLCVKMAEVFRSNAGNMSKETRVLCQIVLVLAFVAFFVNDLRVGDYLHYSSRILSV